VLLLMPAPLRADADCGQQELSQGCRVVLPSAAAAAAAETTRQHLALMLQWLPGAPHCLLPLEQWAVFCWW